MSIESNRYGEQSHPAFRNHRLNSVNGQWYFDTREGKQLGPYRDKYKAKIALAVFITKNLVEAEDNREDNYIVQYGIQDGIDHMVAELFKYFSYRKRQGQTAALAWASNRIKKIIDNENEFSHSKERIEIIQYALDNE